jgi:hypothetical protein
MSELFIRTNKFLKEFQENLNLEVSALSFESSSDEYFNIDDTEEKIKYLLWESPSKYYSLGARLDYKEIFKKEHKELNDKGLYFHYCKFKTYERTYKDRLNNFIEKYEDADPVYFLQDELKEYLKPIDFEKPFKSLDLEQQKVLGFTRDMIVRFLVEQAKTIGYNITINVDEFELTISYEIEEIKSEKESISINETPTLQPLKWQGTPTELIELTKALIENETFKGQGTQKEIFIKIQNLFDIELKTIDKTINSFDEVRSEGNETKFLDTLKVSLLSNINIKRKKRENR